MTTSIAAPCVGGDSTFAPRQSQKTIGQRRDTFIRKQRPIRPRRPWPFSIEIESTELAVSTFTAVDLTAWLIRKRTTRCDRMERVPRCRLENEVCPPSTCPPPSPALPFPNTRDDRASLSIHRDWPPLAQSWLHPRHAPHPCFPLQNQSPMSTCMQSSCA